MWDQSQKPDAEARLLEDEYASRATNGAVLSRAPRLKWRLLEPGKRLSLVVTIAIVMVQHLWLLVIWRSGASSNIVKVQLLLAYSVVVSVVALAAPTLLADRLESLRNLRGKDSGLLFYAVLAVTVVGGVIFAAEQREWTWDEELSLAAATVVTEEGLGSYFDQYSQNAWLGRHHPPLVPILYGVAMKFFGANLLTMRLLSLAFVIGTLVVTYRLGSALFDRKAGSLAALLLLASPLVLRLGSAALTDAQVSFFFGLSLLLATYVWRRPSKRLSILLGLSVGAGLLSKYTMLFIGPFFLAFFLRDKEFRGRWRYLFGAGFISLGMLAIWLLFAYRLGILQGQRQFTALEPGWFVATEDGLKWMSNSLLTKLTSGIGPYNLPILFVGLLAGFKHRTSSDWFLILLVAIVSIGLILTLPDHRYFLPIFPAMAIMMGRWLTLGREHRREMLLLVSLYAVGTLWLFVDWQRASELFLE